MISPARALLCFCDEHLGRDAACPEMRGNQDGGRDWNLDVNWKLA